MNTLILVVAAVFVVAMFGLALSIWLEASKVNDALASFEGFDGLHLEA